MRTLPVAVATAAAVEAVKTIARTVTSAIHSRIMENSNVVNRPITRYLHMYDK